MLPLLSIIIPNYNGEKTLGPCLQAAVSLKDEAVEIIVVDDCSVDRSVDIIRGYPCKLIQLPEHGGASRARNAGAGHSRGEILFFTDADCVLNDENLSLVRRHLSNSNSPLVLGGTYTPAPYDDRFCSRFQSVFIHYSETKRGTVPDYIATHALAIKAELFHRSGGFCDTMGPILEDVEFSHRLRRAGITLLMEPSLQVQHIFNYSLRDSWRNAIRKTRYWIPYSLRNRDLLSDSGTASRELKLNVSSYYLNTVLLLMTVMGSDISLAVLLLLSVINLFHSRGLIKAFYITGGALTGMTSALYYLLVYPIPVGIGTIAGLAGFMHERRRNRRYS